MKTSLRIILLLVVVVSSFLAGSWITHWGSKHQQSSERKILYYVDPMNPAFKSEKPGIAPCGMALEPVYSGKDGQPEKGQALPANLPPGTIRINPEKQQLIGIKIATVEKAPWSHTLRVLGRVAPNETLVYRINTATDSWIEKILPITTGSQVKKNELLATLSFFSLEYRTLVQNYLNLATVSELPSPGTTNQPVYEQPKHITERKAPYSANQLRQMRKASRNAGDITGDSQIDYYRKYLYNYGISPYQVSEMERTGIFPEVIEIRAPVAGFVLLRNASPGLRLEKGTELFRIADLSRVWILADIFENEAALFKPGLRVKMELPYQKKTLYARMSNVLPQFDSATRTLKVRLEADNPGFVMRPDMFVNVEIPVSGPPAIIVPADAVIDSGLKKTVFVDRGNGYFEPRQVETGRSLGERVEITQGLMPGEKIVVSGNFLIDSESRMQQTVSGINGKAGRDSVCGMNIDEDRSKAAGLTREYKGKTYFFCSSECRDEFTKTPGRYTETDRVPKSIPSPGLKTDTGADHSVHRSIKSEDRHAISAAPHDHAGMKKTAPGGHSAAAVDTAPMSGEGRHAEKTKGMNKIMPAHQPRVFTGPGGSPVNPVMPGSSSMSMPSPQSSSSGPQGVPVKKAPGSPGSGDIMSQPPQNPTMNNRGDSPVMPGAPSGPPGVPAQKANGGPGNVDILSQPPQNQIMNGTGSEDLNRAARLRERRAIRRPYPSRVIPGAEASSSLPVV